MGEPTTGYSSEDDAMNDAANGSDGLQKELKGIQVTIAIGTGAIGLLLIIIIAVIVVLRGA